MKLIDADKLLKEIDEAGNEVSKHIGETGNANFDRGFMYGLATVFENIKRQPTAFDVGKVVDQIENIKFRNFLTIANTGNEKLDFAYSKVANVLDKAIDIVEAGGIDE